jgi:hypothetical protein
MGKNSGLIWDKQKSVDKGKVWIDLVSTDGHWRISEGDDELERKAGKPYLLTHRTASNRGSWDRVDAFETLAEAKHFASEMAE